MKYRWSAVCVAVSLAACGKTPPAQSPQARAVVLSEQPAPTGYVRVRDISAKSGKGCGFFGEVGSREGAEILLRDEAAKLGARYVQVTSFVGPRPNHACLEHEYQLSGVAYRSAADVPPAAPPSAAAPPASPPPASTPSAAVAPPRVCVPGATQACLGPGACSGAQACRDDASGYLPCDCGSAAPR
jgi:hypothetical protein